MTLIDDTNIKMFLMLNIKMISFLRYRVKIEREKERETRGTYHDDV